MKRLKQIDSFDIKIGSEIFKPSPSARKLGFYMESSLKETLCGKDPWLFNTKSDKNNNTRFSYE